MPSEQNWRETVDSILSLSLSLSYSALPCSLCADVRQLSLSPQLPVDFTRYTVQLEWAHFHLQSEQEKEEDLQHAGSSHTHTHSSTLRLYLHLHSHLFFLLPRLNKLSWRALLCSASIRTYFNIVGLGLKQKPKRADCAESCNIFQLHALCTIYLCCHSMRGSTVCNQIAHLSGLFACEKCSSVKNCSKLRITMVCTYCFYVVVFF